MNGYSEMATDLANGWTGDKRAIEAGGPGPISVASKQIGEKAHDSIQMGGEHTDGLSELSGGGAKPRTIFIYVLAYPRQ